MTLETPFRLMWTDEEGDNVCFSTDEELAQALKFVKGQENQLFKVIIKTPQVQQEQAQAAREHVPEIIPKLILEPRLLLGEQLNL